MMATTTYANDKLTAALSNHLLKVDAIRPTAEATKLAGELAQVCLTELKTAGLGSQAVENLFAPSRFKAKAGGVA